MKEAIKSFTTKTVWVALTLFALYLLIFGFDVITTSDVFDVIGGVVSITIIIMGVYSSWLWRWNPFEKIPKIFGNYTGVIEFNFTGVDEKKDTSVEIKQTLFTTRVKIVTNEITSNCITSEIKKENGQNILYYTYITNPKSKYSQQNPIQYGTCRLVIDGDYLSGTYWTTRKTTGDISLSKLM